MSGLDGEKRIAAASPEVIGRSSHSGFVCSDRETFASGQVSVDGRGSPDLIPVTAGAKAERGVGMVIPIRVFLGRVSGVAGTGIVGKGVAESTLCTLSFDGVASAITSDGVALTITSAGVGVASEEASVSSDGSLSTSQAIRMNNDAIEMATNLFLIFIRLLSTFLE